MGTSTGTCGVCGRDIPAKDFEDRRAVVLLKKRYCRTCTNAITAGASGSTASSSARWFSTQIAALFSTGGRAR